MKGYMSDIGHKSVLRIDIKEIRLFWSNVVVSLQRTLHADAPGDTSSLDKPPHNLKVGFIEVDYRWKMFTVEDRIYKDE